MTVAIGYVKIDGDRIEKSPDMRVQKVIALVFDTFAELKSIRQVLVWLRHEQIRLPVIPRGRAEKPVEWRLPVYSTLWHMLKNPVYTGAFAYGRRAVRVTIDNGRERLSRRIQASSTDCGSSRQRRSYSSSRAPLWMGSNDPGYRTRVKGGSDEGTRWTPRYRRSA